MPRGHVKGSLILHGRDYVVETRGAAAWQTILGALSADDRAIYDGIVMASSWYPVAAWNRITEHVVGEGGPQASAEMRRFSSFISERDLSTIYKVLLKLASPEMLLRRTHSLWSRYFDSGTFEVVREAPRRFEMRLTAPVHHDEAPSRRICAEGVDSWLVKALHMTGAIQPEVQHEHCRFDGGGGGGTCSYVAQWR